MMFKGKECLPQEQYQQLDGLLKALREATVKSEDKSAKAEHS